MLGLEQDEVHSELNTSHSAAELKPGKKKTKQTDLCKFVYLFIYTYVYACVHHVCVGAVGS